MVATSKFTGLEKAWNNLYAGYIQGVASALVLSPSLEDEQRLSVGVLLTAVKSKNQPSTPAAFHNVSSLNLVVGLISNQIPRVLVNYHLQVPTSVKRRKHK